jgi:hypothetical protein
VQERCADDLYTDLSDEKRGSKDEKRKVSLVAIGRASGNKEDGCKDSAESELIKSRSAICTSEWCRSDSPPTGIHLSAHTNEGSLFGLQRRHSDQKVADSSRLSFEVVAQLALVAEPDPRQRWQRLLHR